MRRERIELPPVSLAEDAADELVRTLQKDGFEAYRVGGSVRDRLLGRAVDEVDVATAAAPAKVMQLFPRTYEVGAAFGVVVVHAANDVDVEVATFREEAGYVDGRHPARVSFSDSRTDARRRDFTINALYYDPVADEIIDYTDGLRDLDRGIIRAIGDPAIRFGEDYLRMLRAVRFATQLGFRIEEQTRSAIKPLSSRLVYISAERIAGEITRMLRGPDPARALADLLELGLLDHWLPEVGQMRGVAQPEQFHPEGDVWEHTRLLLSLLRGPSSELAWAALLHDVGKPATFVYKDGRERFPEHATLGAELSRDILRRLRMSRKVVDDVSQLIANHMTFKDVMNMKRSTLRRLLSRETFADELELHRLDCAASHGGFDNYVRLLDAIDEFSSEVVMPPLLLTGHDVMAAGVPSGPGVGQVLRESQELQLNGELKDRESALEWLRTRLRGGEA